jgi:hypothetical protein
MAVRWGVGEQRLSAMPKACQTCKRDLRCLPNKMIGKGDPRSETAPTSDVTCQDQLFFVALQEARASKV